MTANEKLNKETVIRFNKEVLQGGDTQVITEIVAPDFINHSAPPGSVQGPQGLIDFTKALHNAIKDIDIEIFDQIVEGEKVVTRKAIRGMHTGNFMGLQPSGKRVTINIIDIIALRDGQYTGHWSIRDMQDVVNKAKEN